MDCSPPGSLPMVILQMRILEWVVRGYSRPRDQIHIWFSFVVQSFSHVWLFEAPWTAAHQASLSFTISWNLLKLMSIELVMPSNHLVICHPLLFLPSIFPSIRVFSNESALCIRWPKYWSFSFSISPFNEHSGLISFRMDWLDLLAVQETQESSLIPQFESINSLALSLLYGPNLTFIHDYWQNHSFDWMTLLGK